MTPCQAGPDLIAHLGLAELDHGLARRSSAVIAVLVLPRLMKLRRNARSA